MRFWFFLISGVLLIWILIKRANILGLLATINFTKGKTKEAIKLFEAAEKIGKLSPGNKMNYGYIILREGKSEKAKTILTEASMSAQKPSLKRQIKSILALSVWKSGDLDSAIEMMEEVMGEFKISTGYQNLGLMYILKGDREKALKFNLEAYDYNPDDLVIADNLAESYALCGQLDKAKDLYEVILEKNPGFPEPYYNYGQILVEEGKQKKGVELIEKSLDKRFSFLSVKTKEDIEKMLAQITLS